MAWSQISLPGGDTPYRMWRTADRWVIGGANSDAVYVSSDLSTFVSGTLPTDANGPIAAASDGSRLYVATSGALHRSTDGLTGATWQQVSITDMFEGLLFGFQVDWLAAHGARLIAIRQGYISISDDDGDTWDIRHELTDWNGSYYYQRVASLGGTVVVANGGNVIAISTDGGDTWTERSPGISVCRSVAIVPDGIVVSHGDYETSRISTDGGATWSNISGVASGNHQVMSDGVRVFLFRNVWTAPEVLYSTDLSTWTAIDPTGAPTYFDYVDVGAGSAMGYPGGYANETPSDVASSVSTLAWPVTVTATVERRVTLVWPVRVATPAVSTLQWAVRVVDAAVLGGLNGAASWVAAPSGEWEHVVHLDGVDVSARIEGEITVRRLRNAAAVATFTLLPASAIQPLDIIGRQVVIAFSQSGGVNMQRMFTGVVETPSVDLLTGKITCTCHDQAQEIWANTSRDAIDGIVGGRFHVAVSGEPEDNFAYLGERIKSVPASWALNVWQQPRILPWRDTSRMVTVRSADVDGGSVSVSLPSRSSLRTRVDVRMQYRFTRLRWRGVEAYYAQDMWLYRPRKTATLNYPGVTWLKISMVEGALSSPSGWTLEGSLQIEHPVARSYLIGPTVTDGFYTIDGQDASEFVLSVRGRYSTQWQQTITEDWSLSVVWGGLESQLGTAVAEEIGATLEATFDQPNWGTDPSVEPAIPGASGVGDASLDWKPSGYDETARNQVLLTLLDRAWVSLYSASRSGSVTFTIPCRPDIWLDTRVTVEDYTLRASGDVDEIIHTINVATGRAASELTLAVGLPGNASAAQPSWALPVAPVDNYTPPLSAFSFEIGTFIGNRFGAPPFDDATMIGFCTNYEGGADPAYNYYPDKFEVLSPSLAAEDRDPRTLESAAEFVVDVPTDILEML